MMCGIGNFVVVFKIPYLSFVCCIPFTFLNSATFTAPIVTLALLSIDADIFACEGFEWFF